MTLRLAECLAISGEPCKSVGRLLQLIIFYSVFHFLVNPRHHRRYHLWKTSLRPVLKKARHVYCLHSKQNMSIFHINANTSPWRIVRLPETHCCCWRNRADRLHKLSENRVSNLWLSVAFLENNLKDAILGTCIFCTLISSCSTRTNYLNNNYKCCQNCYRGAFSNDRVRLLHVWLVILIFGTLSSQSNSW